MESPSKRLKASVSQIPRRKLRGTDMNVSVIGFGAASLGGIYGEANEEECKATVHEAVLTHGINFFDTSPYYGETKSEEMLGKCLEDLPRQSYYLASKLGRYGDTDFDFSAARVVRSVDESLSRLGVSCIDLMQCHDIEFGDLDVIVKETLPAMQKLKEAGKIRYIGITSYVLEKLAYVLEKSSLVDTVQTYCRYTLFDNSLLDLLPLLERHNVGIINGSPLAMGLLSGRPLPDWHAANGQPLVKAAVDAAIEHCKDADVKLPSMAMQYACSHDAIGVTLMGTKTCERLRGNVECITKPIENTKYQQVLSGLMDLFKGRPDNTQVLFGGAHNMIYAVNVDC